MRADVGHDVARAQLGLDQVEQPGLVGAGEEERALEVVAQVEVAGAARGGGPRPPGSAPTTPRAPSTGRASGPAGGGRRGTRPSCSRAACARRGASRRPRRRARPAGRSAGRAARAAGRARAGGRCRASARPPPDADDAVPGDELAQAGDPADDAQLRPVARLDALDLEARGARATSRSVGPMWPRPQPRAVGVLARRAVAALVQPRAAAAGRGSGTGSCRARPTASTSSSRRCSPSRPGRSTRSISAMTGAASGVCSSRFEQKAPSTLAVRERAARPRRPAPRPRAGRPRAPSRPGRCRPGSRSPPPSRNARV